MIKKIAEKCSSLNMKTIIDQTDHSRSRIYEWMKGNTERKSRKRKSLDSDVVSNAVTVVVQYPHFGGLKGQLYMLYSKMGLLSRNNYQRIKKLVRRMIAWEVYDRRLIQKQISSYEHQRPSSTGEIWAEDFTQIVAEGRTFYIAVVIDTASMMYLGWAVMFRPCDGLVAAPVLQALESSDGKPPIEFLISDNGTQYKSEKHEKLLDEAKIVHKCIPSCVPQYNGSVECGMRELKQVFYENWRNERLPENKKDKKEATKEKNLLKRVRITLQQTIEDLNCKIPRPVLNGVAPADVHDGTARDKRKEILAYKQREQNSSPRKPLDVPLWKAVKNTLVGIEMDNRNLLITHRLLHKKPLRRVAKMMREGVG